MVNETKEKRHIEDLGLCSDQSPHMPVGVYLIGEPKDNE
jgi:hypothetical protein